MSKTSLLQTETWARFKERHGWQAQSVSGHWVLERRLPLDLKFFYAPEIPLPTPAKLSSLVSEMKQFGLNGRAMVVRLEFLAEWSDAARQALEQQGLIKAFEDVQPQWRQWIDLMPGEEQILAQMKPKGRYNIRLAQRHGVAVATSQDAGLFYQLLSETARRDRFSIRTREYYTDLIQTLTQAGLGELLVASHQGHPLAAAIISYVPPFGTYLHGASSTKDRNLMAPFLLHWTAIQHAKARGCTTYDLLAVAPPHESRVTSHESRVAAKFQGISRFKRQFGGRTVHLLGSWDLVLRPFAYRIFKTLETLRRR